MVFGRKKRGNSGGAADALRPLLFGDRSIDEWQATEGAAIEDGPWAWFAQARHFLREGRQDDAITCWRRVADLPNAESRHVLQAWQFLRAAGATPPPAIAAAVLAASAEVSVSDDHDLLVAYRDGGIRYLNHSGKVAIVESGSLPAVETTAQTWLEVAQTLADNVGVWDQSQLPDLPQGHTRIMMLTPAGKRFGQGPDAQLRQDASAARFLAAATNVLIGVVHQSTQQ